MKITTHHQGGVAHYRLEAENGGDRDFLHAATSLPHTLTCQLIERMPSPRGIGDVDHSATFTFNPREPRALEAQAGLQAFRALGDLSRLLLAEAALNRHTGIHATDPAGDAPTASPWFESFWNSFPPTRRVGRQAALEQWALVSANPQTVIEIFKALGAETAGPTWTREGGRFVPRPARWLRERRWQDSVSPCPLLRPEDLPWQCPGRCTQPPHGPQSSPAHAHRPAVPHAPSEAPQPAEQPGQSALR